jgi:hypothetical protein
VWGAVWGLYCLWKGIEMELLYIGLGIDNLNRCKENGMSVEILIVCQLILNVIRYYIKCLGISLLL